MLRGNYESYQTTILNERVFECTKICEETLRFMRGCKSLSYCRKFVESVVNCFSLLAKLVEELECLC